MASTAGKAIQAVKQFTTTGNASRVSVTKEIAVGLTLGLAAGLTWKVLCCCSPIAFAAPNFVQVLAN